MDPRSNLCAAQRAAADSERCAASLRCPAQPGHGPEEQCLKFLSSVWVQADAPAERLWCTEQLVKGNACGALIAWLPQARPEQIRRLQVCAQTCEGPVFLFRPAAAQHESSAAPLRVMAAFALDWELLVHVLKRRGPMHDGMVRLESVPGGLSAVLTPGLLQPSRLIASRESFRVNPAEVSPHALGGTAPSQLPRRHATIR